MSDVKVRIWRHTESDVTILDDAVAREEPLAIRLVFGPISRRESATIVITMRTPDHDADLAIGFLASEGIIRERAEIVRVDCPSNENSVEVDLGSRVGIDLGRFQRLFAMSSSCGICGKTSLDAVDSIAAPLFHWLTIPDDVVLRLPKSLTTAQSGFARTGAVHAAALFDAAGKIVLIREDVGRHNAVDKLIGAAITASLPLHLFGIVVSGRAGFELLQKAAMAGISVFVAIGAPTSLAIELAQRMGMRLIGFVRDGRFNDYTPAAASTAADRA
jgi:FdhD protein